MKRSYTLEENDHLALHIQRTGDDERARFCFTTNDKMINVCLRDHEVLALKKLLDEVLSEWGFLPL